MQRRVATSTSDGWSNVTDQADSSPPWLQQAHQRLAAAGIAWPERDARALATHLFGVWSVADPDLTLAAEQLAAFSALVAQRCAHVPLERLIGWVRFRQLEFLVGPGVFIPQPETSCVVQWAVDAARRLLTSGLERPLFIDLCSGAGTIALSLASEVPEAVVHAVEVDSDALAWAARNVAHHRLAVHLHRADAADAVPELNGQVDIVTSNPPYVATGEMDQVSTEVREHDPEIALGAGPDGLDIIRRVEWAARRPLSSRRFSCQPILDTHRRSPRPRPTRSIRHSHPDPVHKRLVTIRSPVWAVRRPACPHRFRQGSVSCGTGGRAGGPSWCPKRQRVRRRRATHPRH
jgi:release factor glutamine methyltransferase